MVALHDEGCRGTPPTFGCPGCIAANGLGAPPRSKRRRQTYDAAQAFALGVHPATGEPLDRGHTCGGCDHCYAIRHTGGTAWHKCGLHREGTRGAATDVRVSWPACSLYVPRPGADDTLDRPEASPLLSG